MGENRVSVSKITVALPNGTSLDLTVQEARELYRALGELVGEKTTVIREQPKLDRWPYRPGDFWYAAEGVLKCDPARGESWGICSVSGDQVPAPGITVWSGGGASLSVELEAR